MTLPEIQGGQYVSIPVKYDFGKGSAVDLRPTEGDTLLGKSSTYT